MEIQLNKPLHDSVRRHLQPLYMTMVRQWHDLHHKAPCIIVLEGCEKLHSLSSVVKAVEYARESTLSR